MSDTHFGGWVILDLIGQRPLAGYATEQEVAGRGFLRLDIPGTDGALLGTRLYAPDAVYAITPTTEDVARALARTTWETQARGDHGLRLCQSFPPGETEHDKFYDPFYDPYGP